MEDSVELRNSCEKGEGVFATRSFSFGDTVMTGVIKKILKRNTAHASQVSENKYVLYAGLVSKVNHSCNPNCGFKENESGAHDFVAIKDIHVGEEITCDYAMRNYSIDHFPDKCMCGTENCRGRITGWKELPLEKKKEYGNFVAAYLLELDEKNSQEG